MIEKNWLDLKKPDEMEIKVSEYNPSQAVVAVGPFERGFGVTIGNALRRVLLSSLQTTADHRLAGSPQSRRRQSTPESYGKYSVKTVP